jgi:hypothetical protein
MKKLHDLLIRPVLAMTAILLLTACGNQPEESVEVSKSETINWLESEPASAISVEALIKSAEQGEEYTVVGVIGGTMEPITSGFASFVLADDSITFCNEMESDHCPTPWDACCEDPDKVKNGRISVQFAGKDGIPLQTELKGVNGIENLAMVTVRGVPDPASTKENLILNASGIFVHRGSTES